MILDDPAFCEALERKLRGRAPFSCSILVDRSNYLQRTSRHQRPVLRQLQGLGADVRLCSGLDASSVFGAGAYPGIHHIKAIVLDNRIAFSGGSNITRASRFNRELAFRFTGPIVKDILQEVLNAKATGVAELS